MLIKNGYVIDPSQQISAYANLLIEDGKIKKIGKLEAEKEQEVIDAAGCVIAPGFVDIHLHFRDPGFTYKEDLDSGAKAAAKGGFTSVVCMANTDPVIDDPNQLTKLYEKAKRCDAHIYFAASVSKGLGGKQLCDYQALKAAGAICFSDDGKPLADPLFLKQAMEQIVKTKLPISLHEELPQYVKEAGIHAGKTAEKMGLRGAMREAEWEIIKRDLKLAKESGAHIHIQHISTKEGVALVRKGKQEKVKVTAEATPHHFSLREDAIMEYGTMAKMNPPLREESDRLAIIEGLRDGTIDVIATDHAPHSSEEKKQPFQKAPSGIIGLETAFSLGMEYLVNSGALSLEQLIEKMSTKPASLLHLPAGTLQVGAAADIVLLEPKADYQIQSFVSKSANSPFLGQTMQGKVKMTILSGKIVYRENEKESSRK